MITVKVPIEAVSIFANRARITRHASIRLKSGDQTLAIKDLPETLELESLRTSGHGEGVSIRNVDIRSASPSQNPEERIRELEEQLAILQAREKALDDEEEVLQAHFDFLQTFGEKCGAYFAEAIASSTASLDNVTAVSHYITNQMNEARANRRNLEMRRNALKKEIENQKRLIRRSKRASTAPSYDALITVHADKPTRFDMTITYVVRAARWRPVYDLRLRADGQIELVCWALITQRTGEDWKHARLTVSTARPAISPSLPELHPWYIEEIETVVNSPMTPDRAKSLLEVQSLKGNSYFSDSETEEPALDWVLETRETTEIPRPEDAEADSDETSTAMKPIADEPELDTDIPLTMEIEALASIASDGEPHRVMLFSEILPSTTEHLSAPKLTSDVYLRATFSNPRQTPLLPGVASIFRNGDFVHKQDIPTLLPGDAFVAQFGVDHRVKVQRQLLKREATRDDNDLNRYIRYTYQITVEHQRDKAFRLRIQDQLPISRHHQVRVKLDRAEPPVTAQLPQNILEWDLSIPQSGSVTIVFAFSVEFPSYIRLQGLDVDA